MSMRLAQPAAVRLLALAAFALTVCAAGAAHAEDSYYGPARIRMPTGSILFGVVTELVPGQYVIILLPHGESRTLAWEAIDMVHVRGRDPIGPGAMAPDPRSYEVRTAPLMFAPAPMTDAAPAPRATEWALGARGTVMTATGLRSGFALGLGGEANLVHWFAPELALYGLVEGVRFNAMHPGSTDTKSFMLGGGLRISGAATGTSALFDVATGYRVLTHAADTRSWFRRGAIPLRLGAGLRVRTDGGGDVDLLVHLAPHLFPYANEDPCYGACTRSPLPIGFVGLSLGMNLHV